jgi:hypothetical protein
MFAVMFSFQYEEEKDVWDVSLEMLFPPHTCKHRKDIGFEVVGQERHNHMQSGQ